MGSSPFCSALRLTGCPNFILLLFITIILIMYYIINIVLQRTILNESIAAILTLYQYTNIFTVSCPKKKTVTVEQVPIEFNIDFSISLDFSFVF